MLNLQQRFKVATVNSAHFRPNLSELEPASPVVLAIVHRVQGVPNQTNQIFPLSSHEKMTF